MKTARIIAHLWLATAAATLLIVAEEAKPKRRRKPQIVQEAPWWERVK